MPEELSPAARGIFSCLFLTFTMIIILIVQWFIKNKWIGKENLVFSALFCLGLSFLPTILSIGAINLILSEESNTTGAIQNLEAPRSNLDQGATPVSTSPLLPSHHPPPVTLDGMEYTALVEQVARRLSIAQPPTPPRSLIDQGPTAPPLELADDSDLPPKYEGPPKYDECA